MCITQRDPGAFDGTRGREVVESGKGRWCGYRDLILWSVQFDGSVSNMNAIGRGLDAAQRLCHAVLTFEKKG